MIQFYNDGYLPLMAEKHPRALGQAASECWREAWHIVGPQFDAALMHGETTYKENVLVPVTRNGRLQNIYWTYSYSPIYSSGGRSMAYLSSVMTSQMSFSQRKNCARARSVPAWPLQPPTV